MNDPFGRQPKPVTVIITNGDQEDIDYWHHHIKRAVEFNGDMTDELSSAPSGGDLLGGRAFRIHPRAVND